MGVYINIDVKEIRRGAVAVLNIDDVAFFVKGKDIIAVPDHGDLIDKSKIVDALAVAEKNISFVQRGVEREEDIKYCQGVMVGYANSILAINNAPVVIPAERREE